MTYCTRCSIYIAGDPAHCPMCHARLGGEGLPITTPRGHYVPPLAEHDPTNESSPDADWCDPGPDLTEHDQRAVVSSEGIDADDLSKQDLRLLRDIREAPGSIYADPLYPDDRA